MAAEIRGVVQEIQARCLYRLYRLQRDCDRVPEYPPRKGRPIEITLLRVATLGDVLVAQARIVEAMSDGKIGPDEARYWP
jgi:hypothetical protein